MMSAANKEEDKKEGEGSSQGRQSQRRG